MAEIVETFAGDRRLRLYNEDFARKLGIGTSWTKIRIGIRISVQATSQVNSTAFTFGVCQGDTNTFKSGSTTDFIGAIFGGSVTANFTYLAGPPATLQTTLLSGIARIGSTNTIVTATNQTISISATPATVRSILLVDIEKNFTNNKILTWAPNQNNAQFDQPIGTLMNFMEADTLTGMSVGATANIPYSGAGLWDTLNISWNNAIQPLEISDVIVTRIY